jgi:Rod binding domain-containing protein
MSALSASSLSASLPPIDPATEPASVRNGGTKAKAAYQEGLAFEDVLVNELAQEMTATAGLDGSGGDGLGGSTSDSSSGLGGSSLGAYSSLLPQTLATSVMSAGGTGLALQLAQSIDPALNAPAPKATS